MIMNKTASTRYGVLVEMTHGLQQYIMWKQWDVQRQNRQGMRTGARKDAEFQNSVD